MNQRVVIGSFVWLVMCICAGAARTASASVSQSLQTEVVSLHTDVASLQTEVSALEGNLEPPPVDLQNILTEEEDPSDADHHSSHHHDGQHDEDPEERGKGHDEPHKHHDLQHEAHYDEDPEEHDEGHDEPCAPEELCRELMQVDKWNDDSLHEAAYHRLLELNNQYKDNVDVLWRLARSCKKRSDLEKYQGDRKNIIFQGYDYINQALQQNNSSFSVHKWFAILAGERGGFLGIQERLKSGQVFKKHLDIALVLKPKDTSVHHLLGIFNYKVSMLNWFERGMAETLFGDVPDTSFDQAIYHFLEARKYGAVCWKANDLYIAKSYIENGNYGNAALWLERAHNLAILTDNDARVQEEVTELLDDYQEYTMISDDDDDDPARESCQTIFRGPSEVKPNSSSAQCSYSWIISASTIAYLFFS